VEHLHRQLERLLDEEPVVDRPLQSTVGTLPTGYSYDTIWQWRSSPLDQNRCNGDASRVRALALG